MNASSLMRSKTRSVPHIIVRNMERRTMMERWADRLDEIAENVVTTA